MDRDSAIGAINRGLFLSPEPSSDYDDPLVQQVMRNIDDMVEEAKARKAARILELHQAGQAPHPHQHSREQQQHQHVPDDVAHELRDIVGTVVPLLGRRYTALLGGVAATGEIADWVAGESAPTGEHMARLRLAYRIAKTLGAHLDGASARRWFLTKNDILNGETPIAQLALQSTSNIETAVLNAASAVGKN